MSHSAPHRRRVALLIESSRGYGRGLLSGIAAYLRAHEPWSIYFEPHGLSEPVPRWLRKWRGDGILARVTDRATANLIQRLGIPAIDLRGAIADTRIPNVGLDSIAATRMAFEHLRSRGLRNLAFCGAAPGRYRFLDMRREEFCRLASEADYEWAAFTPGGRARQPLSWDEEQRLIKSWVADLPKPVGVLACNDDRGHVLLNACRDLGILVPDEVAVIGIDNDEILCELANPPLSSVDANTLQIGYTAASLLDQMMSGELHLTGTTLIPPAGVVTRRSSDVIAIPDHDAAAAMRFLREHACEGINVDDLTAQFQLSRRTLERRFQKWFGISPKEELDRVRLEKVKLLLEVTDYPLTRIADLSGFEHSEHMGVAFRRSLGVTPGEFRKSTRRIDVRGRSL